MGKKILLADDDKELLASLTKLLAGYEVLQAADGETAWTQAVFERPDLLLLDIDMPGMNGLEVLRKLAGLPHKPVIIMITGDRSRETAAQAAEIGIFAYLMKPLEPGEVLEQVRKGFSSREH